MLIFVKYMGCNIFSSFFSSFFVMCWSQPCNYYYCFYFLNALYFCEDAVLQLKKKLYVSQHMKLLGTTLSISFMLCVFIVIFWKYLFRCLWVSILSQETGSWLQYAWIKWEWEILATLTWILTWTDISFNN